jgi:hypothetical protein
MQANPGTGTDAITSQSLATTNGASARLFGFTFDYNTNGIPNAGTGFTAEAAGVWAGLGATCGRWESLDATLDASDAATFTYGGGGTPTWFTGALAILTAAPATVEQEGFRFGLDDGNESGHGFSQAQDTNDTVGLLTTRLLRVLLNATDDPATAAYTLRAQKNGAGGYSAVGVGTTSKVPPVIEAGDATVTTIGAASDPWAINRPTGATGDLMIFVIAWDDSTTVDTVVAPNGENGETASNIIGPVASAGTEMRMQAWYYVATGTWTTGTLSFNPSASETCRAVALRVPAGEFDSVTPIGASSSAASAGTAESNLNSPAFSAGSSDGGGRLVLCYGSDADAITAPASGTSTVNNATGGAVGHCVVTRDAEVTDSESIGSITATIASDSWACVAFVVRAPTVTNEVYIVTSANIASGGEATTARLTAPAGKTTGDFVTGRRWDDENGTDTIDITADDYTEVEWALAIQSPAQAGDFFDFRVYSGSSPVADYTVEPRLTVGTSTSLALFWPRTNELTRM